MMTIKALFCSITTRFHHLVVLPLLLSVTFSLLADQQQAVPVQTSQVESQAFAKPVSLSGLLQNKSQQALSFKVGGLIAQVNVDEGQAVKKGQVLASLDLKEFKAQVLKAKAVLENAQQDLARYKSLQGQDALSMHQLQGAETRVDVARSDLTIAQFNYRHAFIRAPQDGRILKRFKQPNELAGPGQPVLVYASETHGWVLRAGVTDRDIMRLSLGDQAMVKFDAFPGQVFKARLSEKAAAIDARTQTFEIELSIKPANKSAQSLLVGLVGHGEIKPSKQQQVFLIPMSALISADSDYAQVYVLTLEQKIEKRSLPIAFINGGQLAVSQGLAADEQLVTKGSAYLTEQSQVHVQVK